MTQQDDITQRVLTDDEILTATLYGQSEARMIRNGRAIEAAVLSKLRAPVADERDADHFRGATKMVCTEDLFFTHRPLIREAIAFLRLRQPAPPFERIASEMEAALDGLPTPAGEPSPEWLEVAALASAPVAGEAVSVEVYVYRQDNRYLATALLPINTPLRPGLNTLYAAPQASALAAEYTRGRADGFDAGYSVALEKAATAVEARIGVGEPGIDTQELDRETQECANAIRALKTQADKDGGQQRAGDVDERAVLDGVRAALPEFRQQDDYLLAHGASLISEDSHEIIHIDTLRRVIRAALSATQAGQGERDE